MLLDEWGTEIALAIATVVGLFVLYVGFPEMKKHRTGQWFNLILGACILLSLGMYFGLRLQGINP